MKGCKAFGDSKNCTQNFMCMFVMPGTLSVHLPSISLPNSTLLPDTESSLLIGHRLSRMVVQIAHLLLKRQNGRQLILPLPALVHSIPVTFQWLQHEGGAPGQRRHQALLACSSWCLALWSSLSPFLFPGQGLVLQPLSASVDLGYLPMIPESGSGAIIQRSLK